jgi:uncharacterized membrane protein
LDRPRLAVLALFIICVLNLVMNRLIGGGKGGLYLWLVLAGLAGFAVVGAFNGAKSLEQVILLPPVIVNGGLVYLFGRTILPGREPLISAFRRLTGAEMTPETRSYTRQLTVCWVGLFAASLSASILLALYGSPAAWSWVVNLGFPVAALAFFFSEHLYRARYLKHFGSVTLSRTLGAVLHPEAWDAGRSGLVTDK